MAVTGLIAVSGDADGAVGSSGAEQAASVVRHARAGASARRRLLVRRRGARRRRPGIRRIGLGEGVERQTLAGNNGDVATMLAVMDHPQREDVTEHGALVPI